MSSNNTKSIGIISTTSDGWRVYNKHSIDEDEVGGGEEGRNTL